MMMNVSAETNNRRRLTIIGYLAIHPRTSLYELSKHLGIPYSTVHKLTTQMIEDGVLGAERIEVDGRERKALTLNNDLALQNRFRREVVGDVLVQTLMRKVIRYSPIVIMNGEENIIGSERELDEFLASL